MVMASCSKLSVSGASNIINKALRLESTILELPLYDFQIELSLLGREVATTFDNNPLLPGAILTKQGKFIGMISRRRFLEVMSRPYGLELFLKRPLKFLYDFIGSEVLMLPADTLIVAAARQSLQRPAELLYEPIVVEMEAGVYQLVDVHQLLVAQSQIHELTAKLLDEQTQAQILQTEKMASLGRMVAGVAHEIKNPVNSVNGNFDFLSSYCQNLVDLISAYQEEIPKEPTRISQIKEDIEIDFILEDLPKILESMKLATTRLTKIVYSLHSFSHMEETKRQVIDIHECIESTLLILNNPLKQGIKVIKNYADLPPVNCYSGQLSQVFMNIISNAIDALVEKAAELGWENSIWQPRIEITTELLEQEDKDWVAIAIADNGFGIPPEMLGRIFEMFFTTKPVGKGTGQGLAISYQIVTEKHGGQLLVRSRTVSTNVSPSDTGTEFEIRLPLI